MGAGLCPGCAPSFANPIFLGLVLTTLGGQERNFRAVSEYPSSGYELRGASQEPATPVCSELELHMSFAAAVRPNWLVYHRPASAPNIRKHVLSLRSMYIRLFLTAKPVHTKARICLSTSF